MEAIMLMMNMKSVTFLVEMSVRMFFCFDGVVNNSYFLLDVCREAVKRRLGVLEERHFEDVLLKFLWTLNDDAGIEMGSQIIDVRSEI